MPFKFGVEVDFDVEFFIFLGDNNAVHQQAEVGVADGSFLNDLLYDNASGITIKIVYIYVFCNTFLLNK